MISEFIMSLETSALFEYYFVFSSELTSLSKVMSAFFKAKPLSFCQF